MANRAITMTGEDGRNTVFPSTLGATMPCRKLTTTLQVQGVSVEEKGQRKRERERDRYKERKTIQKSNSER
jgi:hypothetical protein